MYTINNKREEGRGGVVDAGLRVMSNGRLHRGERREREERRTTTRYTSHHLLVIYFIYYMGSFLSFLKFTRMKEGMLYLFILIFSLCSPLLQKKTKSHT